MRPIETHQPKGRPRVIDFSTHMSGPIASHLLSEMGADVIKVENPRTGDGNRGLEPLIRGMGMFHIALNSGTRSLAIDRRSSHWPELVAACARWADAVLVGSRPADAERRGLDFAAFSRHNPRIVYCSISGFGTFGPLQTYAAHGQTIDALAGLVPLEPGEGPPRTLRGWRTAGTTIGGVFAALGVLGALYRRDHGATHAHYVAVSLLNSALWWAWRDMTMLANTGTMWDDYSDLGSRYCLYRTADDRVILVAPIERKFWERFCDILELPTAWKAHGSWDESGMDRGRGSEYEDEHAAITKRIQNRTLADWVHRLQEQEVPFAPILTLNEALESEHARVSGVLRETELDGHMVRVPAIPLRLSEDDRSQRRSLPPLAPPPGLGQHNAEILRELGLGDLL